MPAGWHSLPELNRAFAVGETAFLTARRRERYSRNKKSAFQQTAEIDIALSREESIILLYKFFFNQIRDSRRDHPPPQNTATPVPVCSFPKPWEEVHPARTSRFQTFPDWVGRSRPFLHII